METVPVTMDVPKEIKEIVDLADAVLEKVLAKSPLTEYTDLTGKLMVAVEGVTLIGAEVKSQYKDEAAAYLVKTLMSRLLG